MSFDFPIIVYLLFRFLLFFIQFSRYMQVPQSGTWSSSFHELACKFAKRTRSSFPKENSRASSITELVLSQLRHPQVREANLTEVAKQTRMVGSNGLEPSTSRLSGARSNHLSYEPISVADPPTILAFGLPLLILADLVEMNRIELSTPCLQGRCSPS